MSAASRADLSLDAGVAGGQIGILPEEDGGKGMICDSEETLAWARCHGRIKYLPKSWIKNAAQQKLSEGSYLLNLYPTPGTVMILEGLPELSPSFFLK